MELEGAEESPAVYTQSEFSCNRTKLTRPQIVGLCVGVSMGVLAFAGVLVTVFLVQPSTTSQVIVTRQRKTDTHLTEDSSTSKEWSLQLRRPLYIGMLTLEKYFESRALSCNRTWGQHPLLQRQARLDIYVKKGVIENVDNVVSLTGIHGSDPWHIQKTFGVLEHMCSSHINQFDWFVRAVDDAYIKVDKLMQFLPTLDKNEKIYTGFLTNPFYDVEREALSGAKYCYGGPAILLSRPLLKDLCPHLSTCQAEFKSMPGDVALAKCISEKLGIQCQNAQIDNEMFYHSYEDKSFHLLEDLMDQHSSLTLHPVKQPWLMNALHHRYTNGVITHLTAKLRDLIAAKYGITESLREHTNITDLTLDDLSFQGDDLATNEHPVTSFISKDHVMRSDSCSPFSATNPYTRRDIAEVIRLANTTSLMGDFLDCHQLVSGYSQPSASGTSYEVQLLCSPLGKPAQMIATSVTMSRKLKEARMKKIRKISSPPKLVFVVSAKLGDKDLMSFMLLLRDLIRDNSDQYVVYVVLEHGKKSRKYRKKHPQSTNDYSSIDLEAWYRSKNINLQTFNLFNYVNRTMAYHAVFSDIQNKHDQSTVLLTTVNVHFDVNFLTRCRALIRPHRRMYRPYPGRNIFPRYLTELYPTQEAFNVMWKDTERPVCLHSDDVYLLLEDPNLTLSYKSAKIPGPFSRTDPKKFRRKSIRVISAYDPNLQMD